MVKIILSRKLYLVDPDIKNYKSFLRLCFNSGQFKRLVFFSFLIPALHVLYTLEGTFGADSMRFLIGSLSLLFSMVAIFVFMVSNIYFRKRNKIIEVEWLVDKLRKAYRPTIAKTSPNVLLVKAGAFNNLIFIYNDPLKINEIESYLSQEFHSN